MTFAAGLATEGYKPFAAIYSTFLQRAYDQVVHDVAIQSLPVRFAIDRAGFVGADGPTHAGSFDTTYLACLPGFVVMAAADEAELVHMVATAAAIDDRPSPSAIRAATASASTCRSVGVPLEIGRGRIVREGSKVAILSLRHAARRCAEGGGGTRRLRPVDDGRRRALRQAARHRADRPAGAQPRGADHGRGRRGRRLRRARAAHLARTGALDRGLKVRTLAMPDRFVEQDKPEAMYAAAGLDAAGIVARGVRGARPRAGQAAAPRRLGLSSVRHRRSRCSDEIDASPRSSRCSSASSS